MRGSSQNLSFSEEPPPPPNPSSTLGTEHRHALRTSLGRGTWTKEVYFPWDMGMLLFSELYAIGVPLFLPDRAWITSIIKRP